MNMQNKKAITVIELLVVIGIILMVIGVTVSSFIQNIRNVKAGAKLNDVEQLKFLVYKEFKTLFIDLGGEPDIFDETIRKKNKSVILLKNKKEKVFHGLKVTKFDPESDFSEYTKEYSYKDDALYIIRDGSEHRLVGQLDEFGIRWEAPTIIVEGKFTEEKENKSEEKYEVPFHFGYTPHGRYVEVDFE